MAHDRQNGKGSNWRVRDAQRGLMAVPVVLILLIVSFPGRAQQNEEQALQDITGDYHFVGPEDTLAILDEDGQLKGYIDVYQGENESDAILSYTLTIGSHEKNHVEFKTGKIHEKYYRFSGTVERGSGRSEKDPDYLRLVGNLEVVKVNGDTGKESVQRMSEVFKSKEKSDTESE